MIKYYNYIIYVISLLTKLFIYKKVRIYNLFIKLSFVILNILFTELSYQIRIKMIIPIGIAWEVLTEMIILIILNFIKVILYF